MAGHIVRQRLMSDVGMRFGSFTRFCSPTVAVACHRSLLPRSRGAWPAGTSSRAWSRMLHVSHRRRAAALIDRHGQHTLSALVQRSRTLVPSISKACDASKGPRHVCLLCDSDASYVTALLATWASGAAAVPLCTAHPVAEMKYFVDNSNSACVLASPEWAPRAHELGLPVVVVTPLLPSSSASGGAVSVSAAAAAAAVRCGGPHPPASSAAVYSGILPPTNAASAELNRPALIIYTSGTTSKPKGVILSFGNLRAQVDNMLSAWNWSSSDVILHTLPLHHVHGVVNALLTPLDCGATIVMHPKFDATKVWTALLDKDINVNIMMGVPTMYAKLLEDYDQRLGRQISANDIKTYCLKAIRVMVSGSAALTIPVMKKWHELTGHLLLERYGMTEVGMALTNPLTGERRPGAVGQPFPSVMVRIVTPNANSVNGYDVLCEGRSSGTVIAAGHVGSMTGELLISGPSVFSGYWNKPKETAETFTPDGWFKTGDSASYSDGYYSILGRMSVDIIKSGGYKISALDIERQILTRDDIAECAVVGVLDPVWGQKVAAVVAMKAGRPAVTTADLREWGRSLLPSYQLPSIVVCLKELPRNAMGKINKKDLVKQLFPADAQ